MDTEGIRNYCLSLDNVEEGFPFGGDALVFKTGGKIFLIMGLDARPPEFNVKCEPQKAIEYREQYSAVRPGFHMNKTHWNTVVSDGSLSKALIETMIRDSYQLVGGGKSSKMAPRPKTGRKRQKK